MIFQTISISLIATTITCLILCWIIASYLHQKPENHLTIVDRFFLDLLFHFAVVDIIFNCIICLIRSNYQFGETLALLIDAFSTFSIFNFLNWFIAVIFVKYVTIFHPSLFADSDQTDEEILSKARFYHTGIIILYFILEFGFIRNVGQGFIFLRLTGKKQKNVSPGIVQLLVLAIITLVIYFNLKLKKSGYQEVNSKKMVQKIIALTVCFVLIYSFSPIREGRSGILQSAVSVLISLTITLVPALFIVAHDNLRNYVLQKFSFV